MQEWRDYRITVELGIDPDVADAMSAYRLDWLLAIHDEHLKRDAEKQPQDGAQRGRNQRQVP